MPELQLTPVETRALEQSPLDPIYTPDEKIPVITVSNFPALGRLIAMRFIEWVQANPGGVIALPTGKTPEHFIKWVERLLTTWDAPETRALLEESGVDPGRKPDMRSLHFVQIDEFYPIPPTQKNSFYHYVRKYYLRGFGLDPKKAMLMNCAEIGLRPGETLASAWPDSRVDLSLRTRHAVTDLERVQEDVIARIDDWCRRHEEQIRSLGGLGFFLGGIGPDGHVGFNIRGSDHLSTTRLMATNYETQAAAAGDLGGIEVARQRLVITIGLGTITYNPQCAAIIIAAGEAKAGVIADAVEGKESIRIPASALRTLPNARFYVTLGAARKLGRRQVALVSKAGQFTDEQLERAVIDLALARNKRILDLTEVEAGQAPMLRMVLGGRQQSMADAAAMVYERIVERINRGSQSSQETRFLHTEPHHDDLMLGIMPHIVRNMRNPTNDHYFVTLTSGFTAVTNLFMLRQLEGLKEWIDSETFRALYAEGYFDADSEQGRNRDVWQYLDGIAAKNAYPTTSSTLTFGTDGKAGGTYYTGFTVAEGAAEFVGFGTGGALAICAAAMDQAIVGVAAVGAPADFDDWAAQPRRLLQHAREIGIISSPGFPPQPELWAREMREIKPVAEARRLAPRPLLLVHGDEDEAVPAFDSRVMADAHGSAELRILSGAGHQLRHEPRAIALLLGWLDRQANLERT